MLLLTFLGRWDLCIRSFIRSLLTRVLYRSSDTRLIYKHVKVNLVVVDKLSCVSGEEMFWIVVAGRVIYLKSRLVVVYSLL